MKHFIFAAAAAAAALCAFSACATNTDYTSYISEKRSEIYLYSDDETQIKIYCVTREQPYCADGVCGEMCALTEIFVNFASTPEKVEISIGGFNGEMNYEAVEKQFSLTYSAAAFSSDSVELTLNCDGKEKTYRALNVCDSGIINCEQAVLCAVEYDRELFESLKIKKDFNGEIYVRLLYDEGCYYYVGVCDRNKNITAYLLDGGTGKVITSKKLSA